MTVINSTNMSVIPFLRDSLTHQLTISSKLFKARLITLLEMRLFRTTSRHLYSLTLCADSLCLARISTDDFLGSQANTSNLALKGIIGLSAMQEIQTALNKTGNNTYGVSSHFPAQSLQVIDIVMNVSRTWRLHSSSNGLSLLLSMERSNMCCLTMGIRVPLHWHTISMRINY